MNCKKKKKKNEKRDWGVAWEKRNGGKGEKREGIYRWDGRMRLVCVFTFASAGYFRDTKLVPSLHQFLFSFSSFLSKLLSPIFLETNWIDNGAKESCIFFDDNDIDGRIKKNTYGINYKNNKK